MHEFQSPNARTILILGTLAVLGGGLGVAADCYSAYSPDLAMDSAFAVSLSSVIDILRMTSPGDHLTGSLLGQFFIPFQILGWALMYFALRPANEFLARVTFVIASYATIIGASLHGSLVYVGAIARDNVAGSIAEVAPFFNIVAWSMVAAIMGIFLILALLILSGKSLYPRWTIVLTPIGYSAITFVVFSGLGLFQGPIAAFVAASGFNLPSTIFHILTMIVLLRHASAGR